MRRGGRIGDPRANLQLPRLNFAFGLIWRCRRMGSRSSVESTQVTAVAAKVSAGDPSLD